MIEPEFNDLSTSGLTTGSCIIKQVKYRLYPTFRIQANNYKLCGVSLVWSDESSAAAATPATTSKAGFELKGHRQRHNYVQNNELLQSELVDGTKYERQGQRMANRLLLLNIRFPVVKSLRTNEDTYATLICPPEIKHEEYQSNDDESSSGLYSSSVERAPKVGVTRNDDGDYDDGDDYMYSQKRKSESGNNSPSLIIIDAPNIGRSSLKTGNNLDNAETEPIVEESNRVQVTVLPPHGMIEASNYNDNQMNKPKNYTLLPTKRLELSSNLRPAKFASDLGESKSFVRLENHERRNLSSISTVNGGNEQNHVTNCNESKHSNNNNNSTKEKTTFKTIQQKSLSTNKIPNGNQLSLFLLTFMSSLLIFALIATILLCNLMMLFTI